MRLPRFGLGMLLVVVASAAIGFGIVANLDRLSGIRRAHGYRIAGVIIALAALAWFATFGRGNGPPRDAPEPK